MKPITPQQLQILRNARAMGATLKEAAQMAGVGLRTAERASAAGELEPDEAALQLSAREVLTHLMLSSRSENVRLAAARTLYAQDASPDGAPARDPVEAARLIVAPEFA